MHNLIGADDMRRRNTGPSGADIEGLGELDELGAGHIPPPQEDGHLQADPRRASGWRSFHELLLLEYVGVQVRSLS